MRLLRSLVHLNRYMEGKERRRKKPRKSYKAIQQRLLETTQRPTSAPWSIEEGRKAGRKRSESNDTGTIAEEWMNETYSIVGDSWLEKGTKTSICVQVKIVFIRRYSGRFYSRFYSFSWFPACPIPPLPLPRSRHSWFWNDSVGMV